MVIVYFKGLLTTLLSLPLKQKFLPHIPYKKELMKIMYISRINLKSPLSILIQILKQL